MSPKSKERSYRSAEQIVADLEAKIASVKHRAAAREATKSVKADPVGVVFLASVKAVDKAIRVATEAKKDGMVRALEAGRVPLAEHLISMGVRLPDAKAARRGRKPKVA